MLLAIGASWCRWCAEMVSLTYSELPVARLINARFVPIWVDADRRPDINERYNLGGWPTTAFLTPNGHLLGGETFVRPERMIQLLGQVADAFAARRDELDAQSRLPTGFAGEVPSPGAFDEGIEDWLSAYLLEAFDATHGGFGMGAKRLQPAALTFALRRCREGDKALIPVVRKTLEAVGWSALYDTGDGGVFRYCADSDWTQPSFEKVLDLNAAALDLFVEASVVFDDPRLRERALDVLRYVRNTLTDQPDGGFFASQQADPGYYAAAAEDRPMLAPPAVDRSIYADGTARMVVAFARAGEAFGDPALLAFAVTAVERVVADSYEKGNGIAHQANDEQSVRGLLGDHVAVSGALLDLYAATDRDVYLDLAQELMLFAIRKLRRVGGGFVDRVVSPDDVGLLRDPVVPFTLNCEAAGVLARLARVTQRNDFLEQARETLVSQTAVARERGVDAAAYALALKELLSPSC